MSERYKPTEQEIDAAEKAMTQNQREMSDKREMTLERLKTDNGSFNDIIEARKLGKPESEIKEYAVRFITADLKRGLGIDMALRIAKNSGILTESEVKEIATETYKEIYTEDEANEQAAEYLFGAESREHQLAMWLTFEKNEASNSGANKNWEIAREEGEESIVLDKNASIKDLFEAIESEDAENVEQIFWLELFDNFADKIETDLRSRRNDNISIKDFFKEYGISEKDVGIFLPIKFKK